MNRVFTRSYRVGATPKLYTNSLSIAYGIQCISTFYLPPIKKPGMGNPTRRQFSLLDAQSPHSKDSKRPHANWIGTCRGITVGSLGSNKKTLDFLQIHYSLLKCNRNTHRFNYLLIYTIIYNLYTLIYRINCSVNCWSHLSQGFITCATWKGHHGVTWKLRSDVAWSKHLGTLWWPSTPNRKSYWVDDHPYHRELLGRSSTTSDFLARLDRCLRHGTSWNTERSEHGGSMMDRPYWVDTVIGILHI